MKRHILVLTALCLIPSQVHARGRLAPYTGNASRNALRSIPSRSSPASGRTLVRPVFGSRGMASAGRSFGSGRFFGNFRNGNGGRAGGGSTTTPTPTTPNTPGIPQTEGATFFSPGMFVKQEVIPGSQQFTPPTVTGGFQIADDDGKAQPLGGAGFGQYQASNNGQGGFNGTLFSGLSH